MDKVLHHYKEDWKIETTGALAMNIRIMLIWKDSTLEVVILDKVSQYMHCKVRSRDGSFEGYVTVVYAFNHKENRRVLWETLATMNHGINHHGWSLEI